MVQKDFHYYGTYVLARAAGVKKDHAQVIATAAQFVDDSVRKKQYRFESGGCIESVVTAHHGYSIENINEDDQRMVWVPFHFLPGASGNNWSEKLICVKNSETAQRMVLHALNAGKSVYSDYLIGITAHVYADTFAHYGFSGISSDKNKIRNKSIEVEVENPEILAYIEKKAIRFFSKNKRHHILKKIRSIISSTVEFASDALGHGAVATYPDRPYLKWKFRYEMESPRAQNLEDRDNRITFLEASQALFDMFQNYSDKIVEVKERGIPLQFSDISSEIQRILHMEGTCEQRIQAWEKSVENNTVYTSQEREIPPYLGEKWLSDLEKIERNEEQQLTRNGAMQFFRAADYHRHYILKELLPEYGLYVI